MAKIKVQANGTKKDAIIKKAAALFRKKGFASGPMRELAESIGVEAASLYNHIGSKSELLQAICFKVAGEFNHHLAEVNKSNSSSLAKLDNLLRFHIHMILAYYDEVYVANHEWKHLNEPDLSNFLAQRKSYENALVEIVNTGIKNNEIKKLDPYVVVLTLLSAVRGLEFWHRNKKNMSEELLKNDMVTHLLKGLTQ